MKKIVILGSTGSIGRSALDVIKKNPGRFKVVGLGANNNFLELSRQAHEFDVRHTAIYNSAYRAALKSKLPGAKVYSGIKGMIDLAALKEADIVLMAIGGTLSIMPLVEAIRAKKDVALASKEALISAGGVIMKLAEENGVKLLPVDSEHSAIFQCMNGADKRSVRKIYLTGSGGPLKDVKKSLFDKLPVSRVIKHPKWSMGRKITVDSATLMNKGLEIIEAKWLFSIDIDNIEVILHPEAVIHSMVEFNDGAVMANLFWPDMRIPILYALSYPERVECGLPRVDFLKVRELTFEKPDMKKFPALALAYEAGKSESKSAVLNSVNEAAVNAFLVGKIKFTKIIDIVEKILCRHKEIKNPSLDDIMNLDKWARDEAAKEWIG